MAEPPIAGRTAALAVLVCGAVVIGFAPILVRLAEAGPAAAGFWRLTLALPLLALLARQGGGALAPAPPAALLAGLMFALDLGFWHYGIALTTVANATVLSNLTPLVVTALAWVFLGQRPRMLFLAAVALAVAGAAVMALAQEGVRASGSLLGDGLSTATAFWYALYFLIVSHARRGHGAMQVMFWSTLASAPLLLITALALGESIWPASPAGWAACAGLALVHVAGQGSIAWALGRLPTPTASVVVLVQPVVAAILGWLLFAEALGPWRMLGAAAVLSGVVLAQLVARPQSADRP